MANSPQMFLISFYMHRLGTCTVLVSPTVEWMDDSEGSSVLICLHCSSSV